MATTVSLQKDAPGLFSSLLRVLKSGELSELTDDYAEVVRRGGAEEFPVVREPGASFNPRPARVAAIVLTDGQPLDIARAVLLAFWSCVSGSQEVGGILPPQSQHLQDALLRIRSGGGLTTDNLDEVAVALAVQLDRVRHLHMANLNASEKSSILAAAEQLAEIISQQNIEHPMLIKLLHAIKQQQRMIEEI